MTNIYRRKNTMLKQINVTFMWPNNVIDSLAQFRVESIFMNILISKEHSELIHYFE